MLNITTVYKDESEVRDSWWRELRLEIQSHAKLLGCDSVAGYSESLSIWSEINSVFHFFFF